MAGPRNLPVRSSQRRGGHQQEEPPMRTRSGRGSKASSSRAERPDIVSPRASSQHVHSPLTRKATRAVTNYANIDSAPEIYASYEHPYFMVFGLSREFFDSLKPTQRITWKSKQSSSHDIPASETLFDESEEDETSEESDDPPSPHPTSRGRGRGGRGSRGGRGRGGRGRGRGGRPRGRGGLTRTVSPLRTRPSRTAAPMFPLTEEDDEDPSNQSSPIDAKESPVPEEEVSDEEEHADDHDDLSSDDEHLDDVKAEPSGSTTPPGSPPPELVKAYSDPTIKIPVSAAVPKTSLPVKSASQTPLHASSTPSEPVVAQLLDPEEDALTEADLPGPWIEGAPLPKEADCDDRADYLLKTRFPPLTDVQDVIASLTKHPFARRSTETLYALAENTQRILKAWQDEYLMLDARTAPHAHPPKKPCNGGRVPMNPLVFEDMKEADLYGYTYDPKKLPGTQDPFTQRPGHQKSGRRELRQRRARDMLDSVAPSEEEEEEEEGRPSKRQRRATRRFDGSDHGTGANTPKKHNGWGGARKKGVSKYAQPAASATPEPEIRGKRARGAAALLHQRIQEMREESAVTSSGDEGSQFTGSVEPDEHPIPHHKRGRPPGSKNVARRSDYGIKKGPRKRPHEEDAQTPPAQAPNAASIRQSLSEGQNQFSVDRPKGASHSRSGAGARSTETVFQATPQPPGASEAGSQGGSVKKNDPDTYMNTTPLSQYSNPYMDDSTPNSASSSRKKPRVKSEKRSQSMTIWWAERKARQKELEERFGKKPGGPLRASPTARRVPGRPTPREAPKPAEHQSTPSTSHSEHTPQPATPDQYPSHPQPPPPPPPPFSAPSPTNAYAPGPFQPSPPVIQPSPLAVVPSAPSPPTNSQPGPGRVLAPAPLPPQLPQTYPSPYGPRSAPRPKSSGPPPLAPAPSPHVSPYPPMVPGPVQQREAPYKVVLPGPSAGEQR